MIFRKREKSSDPRKELGEKGEKIASRFLKRNGYKVIERNYKCKLGEIDIIARHGDLIAFIEVKTRQSDDFGTPQHAITSTKQSQISKTALSYIKHMKLTGQTYRFDVIAVSFPKGSRKPEIEHIENAFELSRRYTY